MVSGTYITKAGGRRAFSLIELLVVIAIMLILTVLAVGAYANFNKARRIRSSAESINSIFTTARAFAISKNQWYRVVFQFKNPDTGAEEFAYWIDEIVRNTSASPSPPIIQLPNGVITPKVTTPEFMDQKVQIESIYVDNLADPATTITASAANYAVVRFRPDGSSDASSVHIISRATDPAVDSNYYTIKLYNPSAKSKIYAETRR
ncbi:MAG: prepilin-type N-terminal cleavage/methylation domain-containing protein [Candidatus Sumerlaeaceae bacterium]|nr:prepilin-type N-terminal cleavage/methylation domain-containing protein [Candidatus Sumerlaeaceae bacterium]